MLTRLVVQVAICYPDLMIETGALGAFCNQADKIVAVPLSGGCEFCGSHHHFIRYRWTGTEWETVNYPEPGYTEKPENYTEDGI